jgi:exonuclease III
MLKNILCNYASLNSNSLVKSGKIQIQSDYIRYLKLQQLDIICFQETQAKTPEIIHSLNIHFQHHAAIWTKHVGIVSFSSNYQITAINTSQFFEDDRFQLCRIEHPQNFYENFYILNIYATASSNPNRREFFSKLAAMLYELQFTIDFNRLIISGDFNYSLLRNGTLTTTTSTNWLLLLDQYFYNTMQMNDLTEIPTFQRTRNDTSVSSVIDYIYFGKGLQNHLQNTKISRLKAEWSDHSLLQTTFIAGQSPTGPGIWRANPIYASHPELQTLINDKIQNLLLFLQKTNSSLTSAEKWDRVKSATKKVIKNYGYEYVHWRQHTIKQLERKRNRILRGKPSAALKQQLISPIDIQLGQLQQELSTIAGLKAGARWREKGERDAGFLKRMYHQRTTQQFMTAIKRPNNEGTIHISVESPISTENTSDPIEMRELARQYYQKLYTLDHVEENDIDRYLNTIQFNKKVDQRDNGRLLARITISDLIEQVKRSPKQSSPGDDGLGYQYLQILFSNTMLQPLLLEVYNNALNAETIPLSWKDIRVRLLPKKGDLSDLKNWRPISLINCDAKIFSRVINDRIGQAANKVIQASQTGFMRGRFIGENGLLLHLLLNQARYHQYSGIGLLLDQEKAYDRVHPNYLMKVMANLGFDSRFIKCIRTLFFGNSVQVNVNGFFSPTVIQERGLRQGDPISPILFNMALEPLLLAIQQDEAIIGYQYTANGLKHHVKTIAYADDICAILNSQEDFNKVQHHIAQYSRVSNAKFNQSKTEAFSLNGNKDNGWSTFLHQENISTYFTKFSNEPFRYLGFYMVYTITQRDIIQEKLGQMVKKQIALYSSRDLSLGGRTTVMNTLIMSKIWHCLRLLQPTNAFLKQLKSLTYGYVWQHKRPMVSYAQLSLSRKQGGIGLLDPITQHLVLQRRHLLHIFHSNNTSRLVQPFIKYHMSIITPTPLPADMSFFVPEWRIHPINHPTSIIAACYKAFDHFGVTFEYSKCSLPTLLRLPLHYLLLSYPDSHWIYRHKTFPAHKFFTYDPVICRLRIHDESEFVKLPRLCIQLKKDILVHRSVKMQPFILPFIINDIVDSFHLEQDHSPLVKQFKKCMLWEKYSSTEFRNSKIIGSVEILKSITAHGFKTFWSLPLLLPARSHWYRVLSRKLPTASYLQIIGKTADARCRLCQADKETLDHFLVDCPNKNYIWKLALSHQFPTNHFSDEDIKQALYSVLTPFHRHSSQARHFLVLIATTQYFIWCSYWKLVLNEESFLPESIIKQINRQLPILLNRRMDLD